MGYGCAAGSVERTTRVCEEAPSVGWQRLEVGLSGNRSVGSWSGLVVCDTETEGKENVDLCRVQSVSVTQRAQIMTARLTPSMTALMRVPVPDLSFRLRPDAADYEDL